MKTRTLYLFLFVFLLGLFLESSYSQVKKVKRKPPRFTLTFALNYNYAAARLYGDVMGFSSAYDSVRGGYYFNGKSYGGLQGGGIMNIGKLSLDRKRRVRATYNVGYNLFYNYASVNSNIRTTWHVFNGGLGLEYNFTPKARFKPYVGFEFMYTLLFGNWKTDYTDTSGSTRNLEVSFKPAHRFGIGLNSGIEYRLKRRVGLVLGNRAIWANIAPKLNNVTSSVTDAHINDSKNDNGVNVGFTKQIVYLQLIFGVNIYFYK